MSRVRRVPGEKPLFWIGSTLNDLLAFPEGVKDEIGAALSVAQFGGKHRSVKPWKGEGPAFSKSYSTTVATPIGQFTRLGLRTLYTSSTRFKRNRQAESRHPEETWSW